MKRLYITAMMVIGAAGQALAADLPVRAPEPAPYVQVAAPVYDWGGIYLGINGGWGFGSAQWNVPATVAFPPLSSTINDNGGVVGGTLGANVQYDVWVFGAEFDFDYSAINTGTTSTVCNFSGNCQTGNNWLSTVRGRFGYAMDRVLFYGTGGAAFAGIRTTLNGIGRNTTEAGWTVGAGVEVALADNWTAKVEYLYTDLGTVNPNCGTATCLANNGGAPVPINISLTESLVRAGVNFKFHP